MRQNVEKDREVTMCVGGRVHRSGEGTTERERERENVCEQANSTKRSILG